MEKSILTPVVETEGLEHKVGSSSQEAGEAPEFALRASALPMLQCIMWKGFLCFRLRGNHYRYKLLLLLLLVFFMEHCKQDFSRNFL